MTKKELKIVQLVEKKKGKIDKVKYPSIMARDITYAVQAMPPYDDIVACIFLGYNEKTHCAVHVHVYRCDSPDTAAILVNHLDLIIQIPENQVRNRKIEEELAKKGQVTLRPTSRLEGYLHHHHPEGSQQHHQHQMHQNPPQSGQQYQMAPFDHFQNGGSNRNNNGGGPFIVGGSHSSGSDPHSPRSFMPEQDEEELVTNRSSRNSSNGYPQKQDVGDNGIDPELQQGYDSLAAELKSKLGREPLLLPPKDYDTVHRKRGNAFDMTNRKCMNKEIVGNLGTYDSNTVDSVASANGNSVQQLFLETRQGLSQKDYSKRNSSETEEVSPGAFSSRQHHHKGLRRLPSNEQQNEQDNPPVTSRPLSPGPLQQELSKNSYFPHNGSDLPNYLRQNNKPPSVHSRQSSGDHSGIDSRRQGSYHSRQSSGDLSGVEPKRPGSYHSRQGSYHSRQSSGDLTDLQQQRRIGSYHSRQSSGDLDDSDRRSGKYTATNLGIVPGKRQLTKQASSPDFDYNGSSSGLLRHSHDENYNRSMEKRSSGPAGAFNSPSDTDLGASLPAMKIGQLRRQTSRDANEPARIYMDEDDPGAYIPIDYTVAARKTKERKAIP